MIARLFRSIWALLGAVVLLRLAGFVFGVLNIDEADFMLFGASLWRGGLPYRDLCEIKPPLGYFTYAPAGMLGGISILPMRVLGVLWIWATALVVRAAARRWTKDDDAGHAAAWLTLLAGLCEVPSFGSEAMMNLPIAGALYFWARARDQDRALDDLLCGFCIGIASLYRHQAAIAGLALGAVLLYRLRLGRLAGMAAAALVPWGLAAGGYAAIGQLPAFLEWTITRNFAYAHQGAAGGALGRFAQSTLVCVGACLPPWALAARRSLRPTDDTGRGLALLLWLTWLPVAIGGRFYEHYYLQFIPPLALLAAPEAAALIRRWPALGATVRRGLVLACALPVLGMLVFSFARGWAGQYPAQEPRAVALAQFIDKNSDPGDRLFVWGHYTPIYTLAGRLPGTRYPNTSVHMGNFDPGHLPPDFDAAAHRSDNDVALTLADLQSRRPALVVDTAPSDIHGWSKIPLAAFPELAGYISRQYQPIGIAGGAVVYRRRRAGGEEELVRSTP